MSYTREKGFVTYWKIDAINISISSENVLYDIAFSIAVGVILSIIMFIPFIIIKSKQKTRYKIVELFGLYAVFGLANFICTKAWLIIKHNISIGIVAFLAVNSILFIIIFSPSLFYLIPMSAKKKHLSIKTLSILLVVVFPIILLYSYIIGYFFASSNNSFRITNEGYAIVYETNEKFFLAKYDEQNNTIDKNDQMIIEKEKVSYTWINIEE